MTKPSQERRTATAEFINKDKHALEPNDVGRIGFLQAQDEYLAHVEWVICKDALKNLRADNKCETPNKILHLNKQLS